MTERDAKIFFKRSSHYEMTMFRLSFFLVMLWASSSTALVVSAPPVPMGALGPVMNPTRKKNVADSSAASPLSIRVRFTTDQDMDQIALLLASASVGTPKQQATTGWNWNASIDVLRNKKSFKTQLMQRWKALTEGRQTLSKAANHDGVVDTRQLLWSNDAFRQKMERAADVSTDPHIWKGHNFAMLPADSSWLQHAMLTAEDIKTGDVVGFCEVIMMRHSSDSSSYGNAVPTIANLVASSEHRRRGIASSLLQSATRYVRSQWLDGDNGHIALRVDKENEGAINLYSKHRFQFEGKKNGQLLMARPLSIPNAKLRRLACST